MKVRHIDLHPDEFLAAVAGEMSPAELGVYWMVCLLCYARGGAIDADVDWLRAKFRPGKGNRVVGEILQTLVDSGRVYRDGAEIGVRRVREELEIALRRIREASESGRRGGRPRKKNNEIEEPKPLIDEKLTTNHQPPTTKKDDADASSGTRKAANGRSSKRGTRLDESWEPSVADREFAVQLGLEPEAVAAEFRDYWLALPGDKGCKLDWSATFRNRCRQIAERRGSRQDGRSGRSGSGHSQIAAALDRVHIGTDISGPH